MNLPGLNGELKLKDKLKFRRKYNKPPLSLFFFLFSFPLPPTPLAVLNIRGYTVSHYSQKKAYYSQAASGVSCLVLPSLPILAPLYTPTREKKCNNSVAANEDYFVCNCSCIIVD